MYSFFAEISVNEENNSSIINTLKKIDLNTAIYIIDIGETILELISKRILFQPHICKHNFHENIIIDIRYYMDIDSFTLSQENPNGIEVVKIMCESNLIVIKMHPLNKITVEIE